MYSLLVVETLWGDVQHAQRAVRPGQGYVIHTQIATAGGDAPAIL